MLPYTITFSIAIMLIPVVTTLLPIEILIQSLVSEYVHNFCITIVSESPLNLNFNRSFIYINLDENVDLNNRVLEVSEMGCSDYIVNMESPKRFMEAFDKAITTGNTRRSDRKLIFLPFGDKSSSLLDVLSMKETGYVANVLLVVPADGTRDCKTYSMVTHRFVGDDDSLTEPVYLDKWDSCSNNFDVNANLFPHDMKNLLGKTVKVASCTYKPYTILDLDPSVTPNGRDGIEVRVIEDFCRWVNCTLEITVDDVNKWGEVYENRTGYGIIGALVEDRVDISIAALYTWYEEYVNLDFSSTTVKSLVTCLVPSPRLVASWETPLLPFSWIMWLGLVFTFFYAAVALIIAQGCSTANAFLTTFGMMVTQSQDDPGGSWRVRSVTGWLLVTGLVLDNAYGAGLAATFTVPVYEDSIDTIQDLVDHRMEWGADFTAWTYALEASRDEPLIKQLLNQFRVYSPEVLERKSFTRDLAFSIEKLPGGSFAIGEYVTKEAVTDLRLMAEDFYEGDCVVNLRKSSPYTDKLTELLLRLHAAGLMLAWETQVSLQHLDYKLQLGVKLSRTKKDVEEIVPLAFRHVEGIFFLYLAGVIISTILFVAELCTKRNKAARKDLEI